MHKTTIRIRRYVSSTKEFESVCPHNTEPCFFYQSSRLEIIPKRTYIIRTKSKDQLLQIDYFRELGCWLSSLKLDIPVGLRCDKEPFALPQVRWMTAYVLYGGLAQGIQYQWPCGCEFVIQPETIDEVFDGHETRHLPVTDDWSDEPISYDRAIRDWVNRAEDGRINTAPDRRWLGRLTLLDLTRQTLNSDLFHD